MALSFVFIGDRISGLPLAQNLVNAGYPNASSIESADIIFTSCPNLSLLEDVYFESAGIIANARPGSFVVDLSPSTPNLAKEISAMATVNDLRYVEAPIVLKDALLDYPFAEPENVIMFTAGEKKDVAEAREFLEVLSDTISYRGEAGSAQLAKCALTIQLGTQIVSAIEADALFRNNGEEACDDEVMSLAVNEGLLSPMAYAAYKIMGDNRFEEEDGYTIEHMLGDFKAATVAAEESNLVIPNAESVQYLLEFLASIGAATLSASAVKLAYSEESEGAKYGLDWSRANNQGESHDHCGCGHDDCDCHDHDDEDYDLEGYGFNFQDDYDDWTSN